MSDEEDQADEICVLQSIYNEEEFTCTVGEDSLRTGSFSAFLSLPRGFRVTYTTYNDTARSSIVIPIEHLPPITLSFKLPKNYPSECKPEYTLTCPWLTVTKFFKICDKLDELWNECKGSVILFTWTNFLKEESLEWVGLKDSLDITRRHLLELRRSGKLNEPEKRANRRKRPPREPKNRLPMDPRIILPTLNIPLHQYLESYNEDRTLTTFLRNFYTCHICFQEQAGRNCLQFSPCGHVFCKSCMEQYFRTRIMDNMVTSMPCPHDECTSEANPQQVKDAVGLQLFTKYDSLLLSVTLDKMSDITYCPRLSCGTAVMREGDDKCAACPACRYVFCVYCRRAYHGVEFCRLKSVEIQKIVKDYQEGDDNVKKLLEKRYGITQIRRFINDTLSDAWIQNNSKNCPNCDTSIEKADGCNKMVCSKCQSFFCWLCLTVLDTNRPYDHFVDANSRCRNQLFLGIDAGRDEEEDSGDEEDFDYDALDFLDDFSDDDVQFEDI